jgi:hypothetical protein
VPEYTGRGHGFDSTISNILDFGRISVSQEPTAPGHQHYVEALNQSILGQLTAVRDAGLGLILGVTA